MTIDDPKGFHNTDDRILSLRWFRDSLPRYFPSVMASVLGMSVAFLTSVAAGDPQNSPAQRRATVSSTWVVPRTPWGEPDLQGVYTNIDELNIPVQRPARFEGRKLEDITSAELAEFTRDSNTARRETYEQNTFTNALSSAYNRYDLKPSRPWLIVDPTDGRIPPLTPEAQRRLADIQARRRARPFAESYEDFTVFERCITHGLRSMMPNADEPSYRIVQAPGIVAITYEMIHDARVIPMDGRSHVGSAIRSYLGDARGHWDGDSLVIETTNFGDMPIPFPQGASKDLRVVERFKPIAPKTLEWSVTFDDSSAWARPWTIAMNLTRTDQSQEFEYACHEGNLPILRNLITSARIDKKAAEEGASAKPK